MCRSLSLFTLPLLTALLPQAPRAESPGTAEAAGAPTAAQTAQAPAPGPKLLETRVSLQARGLPLAAALDTLAAQASCSFSYSSTYLDATRPVDAGFHAVPLEQALVLLLGDDLQGLKVKDRTVSIITRGPEDATAAAPIDTQNLAAVVIKSARRSYKADKPSASLRLQTPILETPQVIVPVTNQVIQDQQLLIVTDVSRDVSGVASVYPNPGLSTDFSMRGMPVSNNRMRNGMPLRGWYTLQEDLSYVDRVDFIKGPAGFMLSHGEPGGSYNVVTKKPLGRTHAAGALTTGSYGLVRANADVGGLWGSGLSYRLNAMGQKASNHLDYGRNDRYSLAPVIRYGIGDNTEVTLEYDFDRAVLESTLPLTVSADGKPLRRSFMADDPSTDPSEVNSHVLFATMLHSFDKDWTFTAQAGVSFFDMWDHQLFAVGAADSSGNMARMFRHMYVDHQQASGQAVLAGAVHTGPVRHGLLTALDVGQVESRMKYAAVYDDVTPSINVKDPVYGLDPVLDTLIDKGTMSYFAPEQTIWQGIYLQDEIRSFDWLAVTLGGRFTYHQYGSGGRMFRDKAFTPRAGLTLFPVKNLSVYALYDRAFMPQAGRDFSGEAFDPVTGDDIEAGLKWEGFGDRLLAQAAVFNITKNNALTEDPAHRDFQIQRGQIRSRGVELDVSGKVTDNFGVVANYALTDAEITKDEDPLVKGSRLDHPMTIVNGWVKYDVSSGPLKGLGAGLGGSYNKDRFMFVVRVNPEDPARKLPDMTTINAALYYRIGSLNFALNMDNITDEENYWGYYSYEFSSAGEYHVMTYPGANYRFTASYGF
jgi:iron complex outermembrane receptor protein